MANSMITAGVSFSPASPAPSQAPADRQKHTIRVEEVITCASMLFICLNFLLAVTKHRLWHANTPIDKLHKFVHDQIQDPLMDLVTFYLLTYPDKDIYLVWGVILMIADVNHTCIANGRTLADSKSSFMSLFFIGLLSYHLIGYCQDIQRDDGFFHFVINLWAIWGLIILKTLEKFISFWAAKREHGVDRTNFISDFMHGLSTGIPDAGTIRGYNYIVSGEDKVSFKTEIADDRQVQIVIVDKMSDEVVTVEKVWNCGGQLLGLKMDPDGKFKDVCLSFALMKLLKRRFLDYPIELNEVSKSDHPTEELDEVFQSDQPTEELNEVSVELNEVFQSNQPTEEINEVSVEVFQSDQPTEELNEASVELNEVSKIDHPIEELNEVSVELSKSDHPTEELNEVSVELNEGSRSDHSTEERTLVLQLLKSEDKNRAFRVIMAELGFLQDIFFSQYPIIFGCGFPIFNYLLSLLLLVVTGWLAKTAYSDTENLGGNDIDLYITLVLVVMVATMEVTETATYLFSDWNKVTLLIQYVKSPWLQNTYFIDTALRFLCKIKILQPVRDEIGQYSLLEQYGKFSIRAKLRNSRQTCGNGIMNFCRASVKLPDEAKRMILGQLGQLSRGPLSNGESSLRRHGMEELGWTCQLSSSTQTILLWHIVTSYCETISPSQRPLASSAEKKVATALSKYCAYLVVFVPDLLPDHGNKAKRILDKVASEIDDLEGAKDESEMWKKMMELVSREKRTILGMGAELGKALVESISDEDERWKVLAEFWAEYVLYLAPSDNVEAHRESLGSGGEFITHLWVLLYHAGVLERPEIAPNTYP